ncbi:MAG: tetratricopeptide repeat protein [Desulfobacteraceae bacterium]|jgi:tetratricopeptide (TPR) repeat protein
MVQAKNADEYISQVRQAIASNPDCGTSHYNLAVALMGQKKYEEAEKELHEAVGCSPTLAEAYVQLGAICLQREDVDGCLYYNKLATKSRAGFSIGFGNIGFIELQRGNIDEAIKNLHKAIVFNSLFLQAYTTLANAYLMKNLIDESIETSRKALEIEPNFPIAHNNIAIAYLEKKEYKLAIEHFDKAMELGYEVAPELLEEMKSHRS